jgi:hypothetical protein
MGAVIAAGVRKADVREENRAGIEHLFGIASDVLSFCFVDKILLWEYNMYDEWRCYNYD